MIIQFGNINNEYIAEYVRVRIPECDLIHRNMSISLNRNMSICYIDSIESNDLGPI
jgi:hypothetical protein